MKNKNTSHGFTLLEVLLVVAAIGILAAIVIVAINPAKQLADVRNAQRRIDVNTIMNALYQYAIDNNGIIPTTIPTTTTTAICRTGGTCTSLVDLSILTTGQKYIASMPYDPASATINSTNYSITASSTGRVTINAPGAENGVTITITR